ncbi:MAG TPA: Ig-like domain-containing protein, partial [Acetobacteraceae bacterium]|nr:Ig-like domain-containing protein [Acetobacteraceae bacterium]
YYAQLLAMGNELGTHSYTHPDDTNTLTPAQLQFEFEQSKLVLEQQMSAYLGTPFTVTGAAVPGAVETLQTAQQIIQYFDYMTGGFSGVGAGYPGAFGFLSPDLTNAVYLAPDTSFDFTLVEYQHLDPTAAAAAWAQEWNQLVANANTPIVLWPWHDYGAAAWPTDPPNPSPYTTQMFTDWIARAYNSGAEFVTEADLAARIQSFYHSGVTSTINGNTIDVTVTSPHAGDFALNLSGLGSQVIAGVAGWYAYDNDSLFLPDSGGSFSITTGAVADDVTHIVALPMRADLLSVTGNGTDLGFSLIGEGDVQIALGQVGAGVPIITGGSIASMAGGMLDITLGGIGRHDVTVSFQPAEAVASVALSADSGASATDFITNVAAQTISGTLTAGLAAGDIVRLSLDDGATWLTATTQLGGTAFSLAGVVLTGSNTLIAEVEGANGLSSAAVTQAYVLDQQAPAAPPPAALAPGSDSGSSASDNITNATTPTLIGSAEAGATVTLYDGAAVLGTGIAGLDGAWSITSTVLAAGAHAFTTKATDIAGNTSTASPALAVTIDLTAPAAPSRPDLTAESDSGASNTDNITSLATPSFTGVAEAGSTVTLLDGAIAIGTTIAAADRSWSITASPLLDGVHAISAMATDAAGNVSLASAALAVTIDSQMVAPSTPDMTDATDKGVSNSDNITNDAKP